MKRKRIQYNELNEEIYSPNYWTRTRLIISGVLILCFGFLFNFSLEEKINKWLQGTLSANVACPITFEKAELSYFLPKINIKKPVVLGRCFGQPNNSLPLQSFTISLAGPSFVPPGIKLHIYVAQGKTKLNLWPSLSPFSQYLDISDSQLDSQIFAAMTEANKSPVTGILKISGALKFSSGNIEDGKIEISSKNFTVPAQRIAGGLDIPLLNLYKFIFKSEFQNKNVMKISQFDIGQSNTPAEIKLKGNLLINQNSFIMSILQLKGTLRLTDFILSTVPLQLFLPPGNTSGTYQMTINGPLLNPGAPQFK